MITAHAPESRKRRLVAEPHAPLERERREECPVGDESPSAENKDGEELPVRFSYIPQTTGEHKVTLRVDPQEKEQVARYMIAWVKYLRDVEKFPVKYLSLHNEGEGFNRWPADGSCKAILRHGYPAPDAGWSKEVSVDLDMASAACPDCHILLVEAASADLPVLGAAENTAAKQPGVVAISNSFGVGEQPAETGWDSYFNHPGIAITASSRWEVDGVAGLPSAALA